MKSKLIVSQSVRKGNLIIFYLHLFLLYLRSHFSIFFTHNSLTTIMEFETAIGDLITDNVEFNDDQLETLTEDLVKKTAVLTAAGISFKSLAGDTPEALNAGVSLVKLAGKLGVAFPDLTADQVSQFESIVGEVYVGASPEIDAAGGSTFNAAIETVVSAKALAKYVASQSGN